MEGRGILRQEKQRLQTMERIRRELDQEGFVEVAQAVTWMASVANRTAKANGFWEHWPLLVGAVVDERGTPGALFVRMYLATKIALIHEEGSETLRELRRSEDIYAALDGMADELADTIIRCLDLGYVCDPSDFGKRVLDKLKANTERPYQHGRAF